MQVEFCGEYYEPNDDQVFVVGREGDLLIDDNPYLHRRFLELAHQDGYWWIANVGNQLPATIAERDGSALSWLTPGARMPLVFANTVLRFTAGSTSYEINISVEKPAYETVAYRDESTAETTIGRVQFLGEQRILLIAMAEPMLRKSPGQLSILPSRAEVANRLGWSMKKFDRKLDAVCQKLHRAKVQGVYGTSDKVAANRRARVVEFAVSSGLVTRDDLPELEEYVDRVEA
jgi:hypothetical protein